MPGKAKKAFLLRASPEVMAAVERSAAADLRSVNAQVEVLLREALNARGRSLRHAPSTDRPPAPDQDA